MGWPVKTWTSGPYKGFLSFITSLFAFTTTLSAVTLLVALAFGDFGEAVVTLSRHHQCVREELRTADTRIIQIPDVSLLNVTLVVHFIRVSHQFIESSIH